MKATKNLSAAKYAKNGKRSPSARLRAAVERLEGRTLLSGSTFGDNGTVTTPFSGSLNDAVSSLLVQSNGDLVAVGVSSSSVSLARYNSAGTLDPTFGSGGKVTTSFPYNTTNFASAALEADQKVLVVTPLFSPVSDAGSSILAQYTTNGQLDPFFGTGGEVPVLAGINSPEYVAALPSGEIVVAGSLYNSTTATGSFVV